MVVSGMDAVAMSYPQVAETNYQRSGAQHDVRNAARVRAEEARAPKPNGALRN